MDCRHFWVWEAGWDWIDDEGVEHVETVYRCKHCLDTRYIEELTEEELERV